MSRCLSQYSTSQLHLVFMVAKVETILNNAKEFRREQNSCKNNGSIIALNSLKMVSLSFNTNLEGRKGKNKVDHLLVGYFASNSVYMTMRFGWKTQVYHYIVWQINSYFYGTRQKMNLIWIHNAVKQILQRWLTKSLEENGFHRIQGCIRSRRLDITKGK